MNTQIKYRARLRVRFGISLTSDELSLPVTAMGRLVEIKSNDKDQQLRDSKWIILSAGGFDTEAEARSFGEQLRVIVSIVGVCSKVGIDVGEDQPTSNMDENWARSIGLIKPEERVRPNVHGLLIIPDDGLTRFPSVHATGRVTSDPTAFTEAITELGSAGNMAMVAAAPGIRLLNLALMSQEPLAKVILAISAVEALGQDENWSADQQGILSKLAEEVEADGTPERQEIADALRRGTHRIGLRQGVVRVLERLNLSHLKKEWDRVYGLRSGVVHGTARLMESEMHELSEAAITLCGKIILALLTHDGIQPPSITKKHF